MPLPSWFPIALYAVLGLLFGSFANVVIWRFPRRESVVSPPSACPSCGSPIRWHDNVPVVSWLALRGRCRDCSSPISGRYPLVEATSGLLFVAAATVFGPSLAGGFAAAFFWLLLVLSFIDLDTMRLPNPLVATLAAIGALGAGITALTPFGAAPLRGLLRDIPLAVPVSVGAGMLAGAGVSLLVAVAYERIRGRSGFGMGDVKLLAAMSFFLGGYTIMALLLGSLAGAVAGIVVARGGEEGLASRIPFGPFLALGAAVAALWGPALLTWYAGVVGLS